MRWVVREDDDDGDDDDDDGDDDDVSGDERDDERDVRVVPVSRFRADDGRAVSRSVRRVRERLGARDDDDARRGERERERERRLARGVAREDGGVESADGFRRRRTRGRETKVSLGDVRDDEMAGDDELETLRATARRPPGTCTENRGLRKMPDGPR